MQDNKFEPTFDVTPGVLLMQRNIFEPIFDIDTPEFLKDDEEDDYKYESFIHKTPKKGKRRILTKTLKNLGVRKQKRTVSDPRYGSQVFCCIYGCTNRASTRSRKSLRFHEQFKENFGDKICHNHYFKDLYDWKKSQKH